MANKKQENPLVGLTVNTVEDLGNGFQNLVFEGGSFITGIFSDLAEGEEEEEEDDDEEGDDEEGDEDELTAEDLMASDFDDLEDIIDDHELDIDVDDFEDDEKGLREAVAEALEIELPKAKKGKKK